MPDTLICVRIAQRLLPPSAKPYDYFPYDRVYLARKKLAPQIRKLFRYYLEMELDNALLRALNGLRIGTIEENPVERNDYRSTPKPVGSVNGFKNLIQDPTGWLLVVPTHIRNKYKKEGRKHVPYAADLRYILSDSLLGGAHNKSVKLPRITFYTPTRVIPILCTVCTNLPAFHAGECTPGRPSCRVRAAVPLKLDSPENIPKSLEGVQV